MYLLLLITLTFTQIAFAQGMVGGFGGGGFYFSEYDEDSCEDIDKRIIQQADTIKRGLKIYDVSNSITRIENLMKKCERKPADFGWGRGVFVFWKKETLSAERERILLQIKHDAQFTPIDDTIEQYILISKKLGLNEDEIQREVSPFRRAGKMAYEAEKKSCTDVDLRNDVLGEVRDQDSIGWCYGFAAADLLSFKLGKKVSAADMSVSYNKNWLNDFRKQYAGWSEAQLEGGWMAKSIKKIQERGACLEENFISEDNGFATLEDTLIAIEKVAEQFNGEPITCDPAVRAMFPGLSDIAINQILKSALKKDLFSLLSDKACAPRIKSNYKVISKDGQLKKYNPDLFKIMDHQLNNKNVSTIAYNGHLLYTPNPSTTVYHASVIVGRRFNSKSNECEYLLRNSWGKECSVYSYSYECEEGNVWVPKKVLAKDLINVTYLE